MKCWVLTFSWYSAFLFLKYPISKVFMAKDPAFLFYPGDYLRDTQCLSTNAQVAYDRIMCEHMRNTCSDMHKIGISQEQLNFFTKKLSDEEKSDLLHIVQKNGALYQIEWVAISICNRKTYSESRAENRRKKNKKDMNTYDKHMENEIVYINNNTIVDSSKEVINSLEYNILREEKKKKEKSELKFEYAFESEKFKEVFDEWVIHRKEKKHPLTPITIKKQNKKLVEYGEEKAIIVLEYTMSQGWTGLYEPNKNFKNGHEYEKHKTRVGTSEGQNAAATEFWLGG